LMQTIIIYIHRYGKRVYPLLNTCMYRLHISLLGEGICASWMKCNAIPAHVDIARALSRKLGLPKQYEDIFVKAVAEPDNWCIRAPQYRHHSIQYNYNRIYDNIMEARRAYIEGKIPECLQHPFLCIQIDHERSTFIKIYTTIYHDCTQKT